DKKPTLESAAPAPTDEGTSGLLGARYIGSLRHFIFSRGCLDVQTKRSMVQLPGFEQTRTIYEEQLKNNTRGTTQERYKRGTTMEYAVLGGGALGLMAAYRLTRSGHSVMVFEQEKIAGGLASGFRVGDDGEAWLEKYYHHLFRTDKTAISTIKELGLGDRLTWSHPRTVTLTGGQIHQLDSPFNLLL
ncbi:MAG TPA: hypothetical protein DEV72_13110, partial [Ktedonobacter sp.]|nr:hypothetical protein [Ktedonobacter sp.]